MTTASRKLVVLGMMTKMPVAGVVWQTLHYLLGFERLGYQTYYVETHARTPSMLMARENDDGGMLAAGFIDSTLRRFGLGDRWAYVALHDDGRCFGMSLGRLHALYRDAGAILNLHGGTEPLPEFASTGRLVYVETDPVQLQVELHQEAPATTAFLEPHCAFFSFAENLGAEGCALPVSERFSFEPTRQPVVIDLWEGAPVPPEGLFTTIGNWRQHWRDVGFGGELYTWSKHQEFEKFLDLPRRGGERFELALSSYEPADRRLLEEHGWRVRHALDFSTDLDGYRDYITGSRGEFTVAKDQNVRLRTGWFSDRSATYLAAGRPVMTQETGFSGILPTGDGLFAFETADDALEALERIDADYDHHSHAAAALARDFFAHDVVLGEMLDHLGLPRKPTRAAAAAPSLFPPDMVLTPLSRRPLILPEATVRAASCPSRPAVVGPPTAAEPDASVVIVSFDNLVLTRLCLESLLSNTTTPAYEVVVVDNGSRDGSQEYLLGLLDAGAPVRLLFNRDNAGFPAACNQGLALARGQALVLLNNDTMVPPGWLPGLLSHLDDGVGLVGPVTNRIGNEAEVPVRYETWGEYLQVAGERASTEAGRAFELETLTMFCVALRRDVHAALGPLDVRFAVGTLEDDDYSLRARQAGYRLLCAEDVLVHHFGEGSFGKLFADGSYSRITTTNRERFERKWGTPWKAYDRRPDEEYAALTEKVLRAVVDTTDPGSTVLVVSRGDDRFLSLEDRRVWHFPSTEQGQWAGHHPADSGSALRELEAMHARGADYVVFPSTAFWWFDFYDELVQHLDSECSKLVDSDDCVVFALGDPGGARARPRATAAAGGARDA